MARRGAKEIDNRSIQLALFCHPVVQFAQLAPVWKLPKPKQVTGFLEVRVIGEFVDIDATISQDAAVTIDITNLGIRGDDALKALWSVRCGHIGHRFYRFDSNNPSLRDRAGRG